MSSVVGSSVAHDVICYSAISFFTSLPNSRRHKHGVLSVSHNRFTPRPAARMSGGPRDEAVNGAAATTQAQQPRRLVTMTGVRRY